jgi:hypothetical protein
MNSPQTTSYDRFADALARGGQDDALRWLAAQLHESRSYAEWFEVLKMQARRDAGLPFLAGDSDAAEDPARREDLERKLYEACGIVGEQLFRDGRPGLAWKYFQVVGDRSRAAALLREIPPTEENARDLIDVAIGADVDPAYGIDVTLRFKGTCDGISAFDQFAENWSRSTRADAAERLVNHVLDELGRNVQADLERRTGQAVGGTLSDWLASRRDLVTGSAYHIDPSHLVATIRIARLATSAASLRKALVLCAYGRRLDPSLVGAGDPPFEDQFESHEIFFRGALGENVDHALAYFGNEGPSAQDESTQDPRAAVMVDLLARHGRWKEALDWSLAGLGGREHSIANVPTALELARQAGALPRLAEWYRNRQSLLMYAVCLMEELRVES